MRTRGVKNSVGQIPTSGVLWLSKPQHMKTTIPTRKTQIPSREGLAFHEIVADGLIHAAHVFGIEDDERFVERVLCIAWTNGARLVQAKFWQAAKVAKSLSETLEVGKAESATLCREVGAAISLSPEDPFAAIRAYYADNRQCRALEICDPEYGDRVRQLIGEALLGGLYSRGVIPETFQVLVAHSENTRNEQRTLSNRLIYWANNEGLPRYHPFMELCVYGYDNEPERDLLCSAIARQLPTVLDYNEPWSLEHWLTPGWKDGLVAARFAPDEVLAVIRANPTQRWEYNRTLFQECIVGTTVDEKIDLPAAFLHYVTNYNPCEFEEETVRAANPRLIAWCAYDFGFWMAVVAELGGAK